MPSVAHRVCSGDWGEEALNRSTLAERLKYAGLVVAQGARAGWHGALDPLVWLLDQPIRSPTRLIIAPPDIRTADPTVAGDIYAGYFALGGKMINAHGRSPFDLDPPSPSWAEALHGFGWLRHMRAADTALARANARALVEDWIGSNRATHPIAWEAKTVSRRLLSWLSQSPMILEGADGAFYRRLMKSFGRQTAFLQRRMANGLDGEGRLWAALALAAVGLCAEGGPRRDKAGSRALLEELGRQILPDGGHVSRNPQFIAELLLDLLPLRQAYAARGAEVPSPLLNAIDRMMPMLRMFRHSDGSLALFNGMGVTQPEALATVLAYDDAHASPLANAPHSGYQRLEAGDAVLICDTGTPPPIAFAKRAHAGTLAFEFSVLQHRLFVNCGAPEPSLQTGEQAARVTAAHSTLTLADTSSSRFVPSPYPVGLLDGALASGPTIVTAQRDETSGALGIAASHNGYARLGFVHRRVLALARSGDQLTGTDRLVESDRKAGEPGWPFALRFHLHPSARAAFAGDGRAIMIAAGNGDHWMFSAGGQPVDIEESIFFASAEGPRRTEQIVIQAHTDAVQSVTWSLTRVEPA